MHILSVVQRITVRGSCRIARFLQPMWEMCRRSAQTATAGGSEKDAVRTYFDTAGFERWRKIYGETDEVNKVTGKIRLAITS